MCTVVTAGRAGATGTAGAVLAISLLVALGLVGVGYTIGGEWHPHGGAQLMNVVGACSLKRPAAHVSLPRNFL